ncbi:MAG TPA: hypothetical protein VI749_00480 [Candidatus Omnitrophota bacterium]|nr:hypothetical protein [Candidatus Omnitrophota bacterium]
MAKSRVKPQREKDLIRRYLIWCYKMTKEDLDHIDRYFTQLEVDAFVLDSLKKTADYKSGANAQPYRMLVGQFEEYMEEKRRNVLKKKFLDGKRTRLDPQYQYLKNRFGALEKAIVVFLGKKELDAIRRLYEEEMTRRILAATEHT